MFGKYIVAEFGIANIDGIACIRWGIKKRFLLFFRRFLTHTKVVIYKAGHSACSKEVLIFHSELTALRELGNLYGGFGEVRTVTYKNGYLFRTVRKP